MTPQPGETAPEASAFVAELRHWRDVAGASQKALAKLVGYTPSYVSKVESGDISPSREFAELADRHLNAGRSLLRVWKDIPARTSAHRHTEPASDDPQSGPSTAVLVEHEIARLTMRDGVFETFVRRQLINTGTEPVTRYLIRVSADRHPGDPERSNQLYRRDPITWQEIGLQARCGDERMNYAVLHDRDAFKELWLLFENDDGHFPLYPGESTWIEYVYTVSEAKWGPWWQRAIRLPTRRLSLTLDFPSDLLPSVWGMETSMTAQASAFRSPFAREDADNRTLFSWSTTEPPLHTRYRVEWKFKAATSPDGENQVASQIPSEQMSAAGIVQEGDPGLYEVAVPYDLPAEADDARRAAAELLSAMERVAQVHTFAKGMGLAAPQIGIGRSIALVRTPSGETITLINPRVIDEATDQDSQYEGCLSFFDVRGMVPRPLGLEVEHQHVDGSLHITLFEGPVARLVGHELDHLGGILYRSRMELGAVPIPVSQYNGTGKQWRTATTGNQ